MKNSIFSAFGPTRCALALVAAVALAWGGGQVSMAQVKQLIQVKTFDEQLQPMKNVEVSINNKEYISTGTKGVVFTELAETDLPIKTIRVKDAQYEAGAWNYSKSILEIVVRKKNYKLTTVVVRDQNNGAVADVALTFKGKKTITVNTRADGKAEIPLALDEKVSAASQFSIKGYDMVALRAGENENVLTIAPVKPATPVQTPSASQKPMQAPPANAQLLKDFDASKLDSIRSITVFYSIFKNLDVRGMDEATKAQFDRKFSELVAQLGKTEDTVGGRSADVFMGRISDSSFVSEDIKNLLSRAQAENATLQSQRAEFDEKIRIIDQKLQRGITNLDEDTRARLLSDLIALETLLAENESRFYKNQDDYRQIINSLKERYFDVKDLQNKLSESEARRLREQREFQRKLIGISIVVASFIILTILLVRFSNRLKRQKAQLEIANAEVKRINENLEGIVKERTKSLEEANRELDTFLYRASHDLRTPVCSIIGLCNIAIHISDGEPQELVKRVATTTEGMDKLLKKLSIISEINQPTGYASITLLDIVEKIQHKYGNTIADKHIKINIDCPADLVFYSYPNLVEVIINNLFENALTYSVMRDPNNAQVSFRAAVKNDTLEFVVHDNGVGLDENIRHRLFDMFFKGHVDSKGNGLGLYIVQKSIQALEGTIVVESKAAQYTQFIVRLPLKGEPASQAAAAAMPEITT